MSTFDVDQTIRDLAAGTTPAVVADHLRLYRESGGAEGHLWEASAVGVPGIVPCLLLTTVGRRSGTQRTSPLFYSTVGDAYVIIGSKGGAETQPGWYLNLCANPVVDVQVGRERFSARARVATGTEQEQLWEQMAQSIPRYRAYQQKTTRELPVVVLERQPPSQESARQE